LWTMHHASWILSSNSLLGNLFANMWISGTITCASGSNIRTVECEQDLLRNDYYSNIQVDFFSSIAEAGATAAGLTAAPASAFTTASAFRRPTTTAGTSLLVYTLNPIYTEF